MMSTGMGGASIGIAVEELNNIGVKTMIRIGSCGALQEKIRLGDLVIPNGVVRDDGASRSYVEEKYPAVPDTELLMTILEVLKESGTVHHVGITRSHDSFYTEREDEINKYWSSKKVLGADMETAALFTIGRIRGVQTASILNTVTEYQGDLKEDINQYSDGKDSTMSGEEAEILTALETCVKMERKRKGAA